MKKILSVVVVFVMLVAMSTSAFAAAPTTTQNADGSWTTAGSDAAYADSMMTILAYSGDAISVDSIQYIDQTVADENGAYSFANYLPKVDPAAGVQYTVKVGGQNIDTPLSAGYIFAAATDITISGTVAYTGTNTPATITLTPAEGDAITATTTADTGAFTISVPAGTYALSVTKAGHTKYVDYAYAVEADVANAAYTLFAGDADGNDVVGVMDISAVGLGLGQDITADNAGLDVDDNTAIGVMDISAIVLNLGKASTIVNAPAAE